MAWKESCQAEGTAWKWQVRVPPPSLGWTGVCVSGGAGTVGGALRVLRSARALGRVTLAGAGGRCPSKLLGPGALP